MAAFAVMPTAPRYTTRPELASIRCMLFRSAVSGSTSPGAA